ncbi:MAG: PD-(D/E)XK nuclease family protein [Clostridium sp.]|nr:PD-(D/E)XK nuclease family protein [Clostridium sp.]
MNLKEERKSYSLFALNIVKTAAKRLFIKSKTLSCLIKSDYFFKEILDIFNSLEMYGITSEKFKQIIMCNSFAKVDFERLELLSSLYSFYEKTMISNNFKFSYSSQSLPAFEFVSENQDISKRLDFLCKFLKSGKTNDFYFEKSENIEYRSFSDIQNESLFVTEQIKKLVNNGVCSYSDIGVFVDKSEARQKFLDIMKAESIPVVSSIYNEEYENFKHKISVYQKISEVCIGLKLEKFSSEDLKKTNIESKAKKEILFEQLDELIKSLITEIFDDSYNVDKILSKQEMSKNCTFVDALFSLWNSISEEDRNLLISEFGAIKIFYESYKNGRFDDAVKGLLNSCYKFFENAQLAEIVSGKIKSLNELQNLYDNVLKERPDFESFKEILEWLPPSKERNTVTLASISKDVNKNFRFVFVSGLTENNFPGSNSSYPFISDEADRIIVNECKKLNIDFSYFIKNDEIFLKQRYESLCALLEKTVEKITFSTHVYEAKKQSQPSKVFKILCEHDKKNFVEIKTQSVNELKISDSKLNFNNKVLQCEKIVPENDVLKLSASAVSTYQKCPRKYYYKHLLNLKEPYVFAASYGSAVHSVMELLCRRFLHSYNKRTAIELAEILFDAKTNEKKAVDAGFKQTDVDLIKETDVLSIAQMKDNLRDAFEDLDMTGFFDEVPENVVCEKAFSFKLEELPNVVFEGRIDAIVQSKDNIKVVDYKTGKDKDNKLSYAISENGVKFKTETGKEPSNVDVYKNRYDYQIPLYYMACQNDDQLSEYKNKITELGLVYIRPKMKENGCKEDFVSASKIEEFKKYIIQNLKENIIDKIVNEKDFKKKNGWACETCAFKFLCDEDDADE